MADWEELYRQAAAINPIEGSSCIVAYNSVLDLVRRVDRNFLSALPVPTDPQGFDGRDPEVLEDLAQALAHSMAHGSALELLCSDAVMGALVALGPHEVRPGGQVVNIAMALSNFGASRVVVHPDRFDERVAALYKGTNALVPRPGPGGLEFVAASNFFWDCDPEVHIILEYGKGDAFRGPPAPRANRLIAAPRTAVQFHPEFEECLAHVARLCNRTILAGLNHVGHDHLEAYRVVQRHIETIRDANPGMQIHLEFTSMQREERREALVREILPLVDSTGLNEVELAEVAQVLGGPNPQAIQGDIIAQLRAIRALQGLGVARVHLHTLGHYLCATPNDPRGCRTALLFSALVAAGRALRGKAPGPPDLPEALSVPLSDAGLAQIGRLADYLVEHGVEADRLASEGLQPEEGLVIIPTKVVERPEITVGLGDVISGSAFVAEPWILFPRGGKPKAL